MKMALIWMIVLAALVGSLWGCQNRSEPAADVADPSTQETQTTPVEFTAGNITSFSFEHSSSAVDGCYTYRIWEEDGRVIFGLEEHYTGGRNEEFTITESALLQIGQIAERFKLDRWDGFHENNPLMVDGSGFSLSIGLKDGRSISASGNNCFPEGYEEAMAPILELCRDLIDMYADSE